MRRGVNARDTSLRSIVCLGGSSQMIIPVSTGVGDIVSSVVPWFELNVSASRFAASTSWNRESAKKSSRSL
jgi:hypothetical protein